MDAEIFIQIDRLNLQADIACINRGGKINIYPELEFKYPQSIIILQTSGFNPEKVQGYKGIGEVTLLTENDYLAVLFLPNHFFGLLLSAGFGLGWPALRAPRCCFGAFTGL